MKIFLISNILFISLIVFIQSIQLVEAKFESPFSRGGNCNDIEIINTKFGNIFKDTKSNCCEYPGIKCDENDKVTEIVIKNKEINTEIPPELFELKYLEKLDLSNNKLKGSISEKIMTLTNLKVLNLENNSLEGYVPYELKYLGNLEVLKLNGNKKLQGYVPTFAKLTECNYLSTGLCHLSGYCEGNVMECNRDTIYTSNRNNNSPTISNEELANSGNNFETRVKNSEKIDLSNKNYNDYGNDYSDDEYSSNITLLKTVAVIFIGVALVVSATTGLFVYNVKQKQKNNNSNNSNNNTNNNNNDNNNNEMIEILPDFAIDIIDKESENSDITSISVSTFQENRLYISPPVLSSPLSSPLSIASSINSDDSLVIQPTLPVLQGIISTPSSSYQSSPCLSIHSIISQHDIPILPPVDRSESPVIQPVIPVVSPVLNTRI
ncbi:hypothetical protein PIROE2DRAFT_19129 [Piromyces sp. E2]|nr:hypothetical protein PIROE2DRAFT_19129 [Piromyces sp. E2]|eukprot:OUM56313.1 hypothetical protein PIROE2DRAFT_19129 [Piromyces sp. E2]